MVQHSMRLCSVQCRVDQLCRPQLLHRVLRHLTAMLQVYMEFVPAGYLSRSRSQLEAPCQSPAQACRAVGALRVMRARARSPSPRSASPATPA